MKLLYIPTKYKIIFLLFLFSAILLPASDLNADIFYWPSQYNSIYNEKVALELELKTLKRQFANEKSAFEARIKELESNISDLNNKLELCDKNKKEDAEMYQARIKELENLRDTLKKTGSQREKELINEITVLQKKCQEESDRLRAELQKERQMKLDELTSQKSEFEKKISGLEAKIASLEDELAEIKKLSESQKAELDRMSMQAGELEKQLADEIKRGEIRLKRLHEKLIINIDDKISFDSGSSELKKEVLNALGKVAEILSNYPENTLVIEGHTDNIPISSKRFRDNWQLSTERALAVLNYLLKNTKLDPVRFQAAGFGEFQPIVSNDTPENRALNRRVDIVVVPRLSKK
jgi:chemotaxis protein MotB